MPERAPSRLVASLLLGLAALARADGWDHEREERLKAEAAAAPYTRLLLEPGEALVYRMTTKVFPPRIPLLSSGRTITIESRPEFAVAGLDAEGYDLRVKVPTTVEGRDLAFDPLEFGAFRLTPRGRRTPARPDPETPGFANASQLFRDLSELASTEVGATYAERKWFYFYESGFGVPRLEVDITYRSLGVDPETGELRLAMHIQETPGERHRSRGFHADGEIRLDRLGQLVRIEARGKLWKKVLFVTIGVPCTYDVERLERRLPAAPGAAP